MEGNILYLSWGIGLVSLFAGALLGLPMSLLRSGMRAVGAVLLLVASYGLILGIWGWCLILAYATWGWTGVIIGIVLMGLGVIPVGAAAMLLTGHWGTLFTILAGVAIVAVYRAVSLHMREHPWRTGSPGAYVEGNRSEIKPGRDEAE